MSFLKLRYNFKTNKQNKIRKLMIVKHDDNKYS